MLMRNSHCYALNNWLPANGFGAESASSESNHFFGGYEFNDEDYPPKT